MDSDSPHQQTSKASKLILKSITNLFKKSSKKDQHSTKEQTKVLDLTSTEIKDEKEILKGIIKFHDKTAVQIMTSRIDISALDLQSDLEQVISLATEAGFSRIPIYSNSIDTIKGILYIKDLLPYVAKSIDFRWQNLIRPAFFVPETKKIDKLLEEFRANKVHLAVVIDEFGNTSGIITMEDIIEEIVGEIRDEYDDDDSRYTKLPDGSYIFEAKTQLTDFFRITGIEQDEFGNLTDDVETIAGLILEIKGNIPKEKEVVIFGKYTFLIMNIDQRRISKIKFFIRDNNSDEEKTR